LILFENGYWVIVLTRNPFVWYFIFIIGNSEPFGFIEERGAWTVSIWIVIDNWVDWLIGYRVTGFLKIKVFVLVEIYW